MLSLSLIPTSYINLYNFLVYIFHISNNQSIVVYSI